MACAPAFAEARIGPPGPGRTARSVPPYAFDEAGGTTLEESLRLWERGEELAKVCQEWLDGAKARLDAALAAREDA